MAVLVFLYLAALVVLVVAWFGSCSPAATRRGCSTSWKGVLRWHNRVGAYAWVLVTNRYPPFRLAP